MSSRATRRLSYTAISDVDSSSIDFSDISSPLPAAPKIPEHAEKAVSTKDLVQIRSLARPEQHSWHFAGHGAVDAVLALGPVLFLVMSGLCLGLHDKQVSPYGEKIKALTLISPTLFPIIYAAIIGKLLRRIGLFKAERGTTIGDLERLVGCQSIFSSFERFISLRHFDLAGVAILFTWLLSPLGGQASLRLLSTRSSIGTSSFALSYFPVENYARSSYIQTAQDAQEKWHRYGPIYMTALRTSYQRLNAPVDIFGNIRIPDIHDVQPQSNTELQFSGDWISITNHTSFNYTSILGIPIRGVPESGDCTFAIKSSHWTVACDSRSPRVLVTSRPSHLDNRPDITQASPANLQARNRTFEMQVNEENSTNTEIRFKWQSINNDEASFGFVSCLASPRVVDSLVSCHDGFCKVRAMREVTGDPSDLWGAEHSPRSVFRWIGRWMPGADVGIAQSISSTNELVEHWIMAPNLQTLGMPIQDIFRDYSLELLSRRLQTVINTFWDSTIDRISTKDVADGNNNATNNSTSSTWLHTPSWEDVLADGTINQGEVYVCRKVLAAITIVASAILFVAANMSMLLGIIVRAPDILGFVSTSVRDNVYIKEHVSSYHGGLETARALRNVRVKIGDVKGKEDVGHIALATMDAEPKRLSWTRMYD